MNKNTVIYATSAAIVILCIIFVSMVLARTENTPVITGDGTKYEEDVLTVSGEGKVSMRPDVAYVNIGVQTFDKDAKRAQDENKQIMERVVKQLKELGIAEKDMQTSNYSVWPEYDYQNKERMLKGYRVDNVLKVTVRDVDGLGEILNAACNAGANNIYGIRFGILDRDKAYKEALKKAIDDAASKGKVMAARAGVKIIKPVAIYEGSAPQSIYRYEGKYLEGGDIAGAVPVSAGELEVTARVTVVYRID